MVDPNSSFLLRFLELAYCMSCCNCRGSLDDPDANVNVRLVRRMVGA